MVSIRNTLLHITITQVVVVVAVVYAAYRASIKYLFIGKGTSVIVFATLSHSLSHISLYICLYVCTIESPLLICMYSVVLSPHWTRPDLLHFYLVSVYLFNINANRVTKHGDTCLAIFVGFFFFGMYTYMHVFTIDRA